MKQKSKNKNHCILSALRKVISYFEIPKGEYDKEIAEFFKDSPELVDIMEKQSDVYTDYLGGSDHCISTGNVMFRYVVNANKKHIYIVGLIARDKKILVRDMLDIRSVLLDFAKKLQDDWVLFASVNNNSRGIVDKLKKKAETLGGKKVLEKSFGKTSFINKPEFTFDTIVLATDSKKLQQPLALAEGVGPLG